MIVVDTNVIASLYLETEQSRAAEKALLKDADWAAPILWRSQFRNLLVQSLRKRRFDLHHSLQLLEAAETQLRNKEFEVPGPTVLQLATRSGCTAYDCEFVALAQDLRVPLVTLDKQILASFPSLAVALEEFVEPTGKASGSEQPHSADKEAHPETRKTEPRASATGRQRRV